MRNLVKLIITNFLGWQRNQNEKQIDQRRGTEVQNFHISKRMGSLTKAYGYTMAGSVLGNTYVTDGDNYASDGVSDDIQNIESLHQWRTTASDLFVAHISTDDHIRYWNNTAAQWDRIDDDETHVYDKARFITRDDALVVGAGSATDEHPVFVKWYEAETKFYNSSYTAGFFSDRNRLAHDTSMRIWPSTLITVVTDDYANWEIGYFGYFVSEVYDNAQGGDASAMQVYVYNRDGTADKSHIFGLHIASDAAAQGTFNSRVTHFDIYRDKVTEQSQQGSLSREGAFHLARIPIKNAATDEQDFMPVYASGRVVLAAGAGTLDTDNAFYANNCFSSLFMRLYDYNTGTDASAGSNAVAYALIEECETDTVLIATDDPNSLGWKVGTYDTDGTYDYEVLSRWYATSSSFLCKVYDSFTNPLITTFPVHRGHSNSVIPKYNYKYALVHKNRQYIANLYDVEDGSQHKNWIGVSGFSGEGNFMYDVYSTIISLADYGVREIMGIGRIMDYIIVFGDNDIIRLNVSSGSTYTWSVEETLQNVGCIAPDSITYIMSDIYKHSGYYYMSNDGIRVFDGNRSILISEAIHDPADFPFNQADLSTFRFGYNAVMRELHVESGSAGIRFKLDLVTGEWTKMTGGSLMESFLTTYDGNLLGVRNPATKAEIHVHGYDGTDYLTAWDTTDIVSNWQSKTFDFGAPGVEKILQEVTINYKSDSGILLNWYKDDSTTSDAMSNLDAFGGNAVLTSVTKGFPIGTRGNEFSFVITATDDSDTNLEIDKITIAYTIEQSERFD